MAPEDKAEVELDDDALGNAVGGAVDVTLNTTFTPTSPEKTDPTASQGGGDNSTNLVYASTFVPFSSGF
ncbi:MAG: hypothetical protein RL720_528 [Actinomycetota bacterium]|jgi:hypothetical protein